MTFLIERQLSTVIPPRKPSGAAMPWQLQPASATRLICVNVADGTLLSGNVYAVGMATDRRFVMRAVFIPAFLATLVLSTGMAVSAAHAQSRICHRLWVERNQIYKDYGYCFKSEQAIRYFGNRGCRYDYEEDIPMSPRDRALVERIQARERDHDCR
jgi:hypothetical protein